MNSIQFQINGKVIVFIIFFAFFQQLQADNSTDLTQNNNRGAMLATQSLLLDVTRDGENIYAVGEQGIILAKEATKSWRQVANVPTRITLTGVDFVGNNGWVVGHDAIILHSNNAGETWQRQYIDSELESPLLDVLFWDENNGLAIGAYGLALFTSDGGANWTRRELIPDLDWHLNAIVQIDGNTLIIVGESGVVVKSTDLGITWQEFTIPYEGSMFGVVYSNEELIAFGLRGNIFSSHDNGETWIQLLNETQDSLFGGVVHDEKVILVGAKGRTLVRSFGAENFSDYQLSIGFDLTAIELLGEHRYLFLGEKGVQEITID